MTSQENHQSYTMEANLDSSECDLELSTISIIDSMIGESSSDVDYPDDANNNSEDKIECILDRTLWIGQLWPTVSERLDLKYLKVRIK